MSKIILQTYQIDISAFLSFVYNCDRIALENFCLGGIKKWKTVSKI